MHQPALPLQEELCPPGLKIHSGGKSKSESCDTGSLRSRIYPWGSEMWPQGLLLSDGGLVPSQSLGNICPVMNERVRLPRSQCPQDQGPDPCPSHCGATSQQASSPRAGAPGKQSPWPGRSLGRGLQEALRSRTSPNITFPARIGHPGSFLLLCVTFLPGPWVQATQGTSAWHFISLLLPVTI